MMAETITPTWQTSRKEEIPAHRKSLVKVSSNPSITFESTKQRGPDKHTHSKAENMEDDVNKLLLITYRKKDNIVTNTTY